LDRRKRQRTDVYESGLYDLMPVQVEVKLVKKVAGEGQTKSLSGCGSGGLRSGWGEGAVGRVGRGCGTFCRRWEVAGVWLR